VSGAVGPDYNQKFDFTQHAHASQHGMAWHAILIKERRTRQCLIILIFRRIKMANTRFEYVKQYEQDDGLLPGCWIVVRLDGKGFSRQVP